MADVLWDNDDHVSKCAVPVILKMPLFTSVQPDDTDNRNINSDKGEQPTCPFPFSLFRAISTCMISDKG
jgi:hypothetical protein